MDDDPVMSMIKEASKEAAQYAYRKGRRDILEQIISMWNDERVQAVEPFDRLLLVRDLLVQEDREHNIKGYGDG